MSKRSRSCSDLRDASIIKSTRRKTPQRDSSTRLSSPYAPSPALDDFDIDDIDVPSYDIERQLRKNETLSKLIHSLIIEKQSRENRQSSFPKSQRSSVKFSSYTKTSTKKPSSDRVSISSSKSKLRKEHSIQSNITEDDIEYMREVIRNDKGLPSIKLENRKCIDVHKRPKILPKPTKLSESRYQCTRALYPGLKSTSCRDRADSRCHKNSIDEDTKSPEEIWGEEDLRRLKYLAESHKSSDPSYKYNRGFTLRYQHNKGYPAMPDSFRQSYERYNKPLFRIVKEFELPRKHLMPKFPKNEISFLGLYNEVPLRIDPTRTEEEECIKPRKRIAKQGRVVRMVNVKPSGPKFPWNYGARAVRSSSPASR